MHAALLAAYLQETSAASLCDLEDDGYIVNNAGYHLVGAGRLDDLRVRSAAVVGCGGWRVCVCVLGLWWCFCLSVWECECA